MRISIITPLLNAEPHIDRLIASQLAQAHDDWEHIIVDGGSTDGSIEKLEAVQARDARFRIIPLAGSSIYEAAFEGFAQATGDIFGWINADDAHTPWALMTVAQFMSASNARWITGLPGAWDGFGRLRYLRPQGLYPQSFIRKGYFHADFLGFLQTESMFFRRSLLDELTDAQRSEILRSKLAGDYLLWRAFAHYEALTPVPTLLGGFCQHGRNRSVTEFEAYMKEVYASGAWRPPSWLGRRLGKAFAMVSALRARRLSEEADHFLARELDGAADTKRPN